MIFFLFHIEIEEKCGWIIGGGGGQRVCWPPSQIIGGRGLALLDPPLFVRLSPTGMGSPFDSEQLL